MKRATEHNAPKIATSSEFSIQAYFQTLGRIVPQLPYTVIQEIVSLLAQAFEEGRTVFIFGNGGSAATASHLMCDLNKGTVERKDARRFKVMALADHGPLLTAWANDAGYEHVFSEPLRNFACPGDVVLAISSSGNSPNIIEALKTARDCGAVTMGMTGGGGGSMKELCNVCAVVPCDNIQIIEDLHHAMAHSIVAALRARFALSRKAVASAGLEGEAIRNP